MKIYGTGSFKAPGSSRVVWDFDDGPFDTVNPMLIAEAKRRGYSFTAPPPPPVREKRKPGRPPKEASNADEKSGAAKKAVGDRSRAGKEDGSRNAEGQEATKEKEGQ